MTMIATSTATTRHVVRLVHSATGREIAPAAIGALTWPHGWWARVAGGAVVVASTSTVPGPPHIDLILPDAASTQALALPAPVAGQAPNSVRVPLAAGDSDEPGIDVPVNPIDMTLTVVLQSDTGPSEGKTVTVRGASGSPTVTLTEGERGVYTSDPRQWGKSLIDANLRVGATTVRKFSMDYSRAKTRIHVVDPT